MTSTVLDGGVAYVPGRFDLGRGVRRLGSRRNALSALVFALGLGTAWYGHDWWTVGRFIESTDDAYVGGDITVIAPEGRGLHRRGRGHRQPGGPCRRSAGEARRSRLPGRAGAGDGDASPAQQATLANLDATRQLQQAMIAQAEAELAATAAEIARAKYDVDRYRSLIQRQFASLQRFQQADADYKKATRRRPEGARRGRRRPSASST